MASGALEVFLRKKEEIQAYKRYLEKHYPKVSKDPDQIIPDRSTYIDFRKQHAVRIRLPHIGENI